MKFNDLDCVVVANPIHGDCQYSEVNNIHIPAGKIGTVVNVFDEGKVYEVEFLLPDADNELYSVVLEVKAQDLLPYYGD